MKRAKERGEKEELAENVYKVLESWDSSVWLSWSCCLWVAGVQNQEVISRRNNSEEHMQNGTTGLTEYLKWIFGLTD